MRNFKKKHLVNAILLGALATASTTSHTSDVDVYKAATQGSPSILLMLDTSGSMGISSLVLPKNNAFGSPGDVEAPICDQEPRDYTLQWKYNKVDKRGATIPVIGDPSRTVPNKTQNKTSFYHVARVGGQDIEFYTRGCEKTITVDGRSQLVSMEDRLSRLKMALVELLADKSESGLKNDITMGLGHYSARANPNSSTTLKVHGTDINMVDGHSGTILVSAKKLDDAQRVRLVKAITQFQSVDTITDEKGDQVTTDNVSFNQGSSYSVSRLSPVTKSPLNIYRSSGGTPTAHAYAEVAAYMMGTSTGGAPNDMKVKWVYDSTSVNYNRNDRNILYWVCMQTSNTARTFAFGSAEQNVKQCYNQGDKDQKILPEYLIRKNDNKVYLNLDNIGNSFLNRREVVYNNCSYFQEAGYVHTGQQNGRNVYCPTRTVAVPPVLYTELWKQNSQTKAWERVTAAEANREIGGIPYDSSKNQYHYVWELMKKIPYGWRLGGSMKVEHEPMDIEPVSGGIWYADAELGHIATNDPMRTFVTYRTNPFTTEQEGTGLSCPDGNGWRYDLMNDNSQFRCRSQTDAPTTQQNCNNGWYSDCWVNNNRQLVGRHRKEAVRTSSEADNMLGGMRYSDVDSMDSTKNQYKKVASTDACDGNGIYFLTDGAPNSTKDEMAQTIMNRSLKDSQYQFSGKPSGNGVLSSPALLSGMFSGETGGWEYIGEYAKKLADPTKNPAGVSIKTAVVGFGSSFESVVDKNNNNNVSCDLATNEDAKNACKWGSDEYGRGGFYYANDAAGIKKSIIDFVNKVSTTVEPVSTGSPTIPADSFNPTQAPMVAYYGSFTPKPNDATQLWLGNMNKYNISDSEIVGSTDTTTVRTALFGTDGKLNAAVRGLWAGGVLEKLKLQKTAGETEYARKIYTDRSATGLTDSDFENSATLQQVTEGTLFDDDGNLTKDPYKNYWLNILGYDINVSETADKDNLPSTTLRQLGAVMHSDPLLLTQEGELKVVLKKDDEGRETGERVIQGDGRKDYLLYGSTQGLLHVIDNETGEEKFAFVPNEMMRTQKEALLHEGKSTGGVKGLFYGIDAPWTAYTQYVVDGDDAEKLTVNNENKRFNKDEPSSLATAGVQWVYGGLRMGGRSYYALDLTDIDTPKLRFHIDPANNTVYANGSSKTYDALQYMGQSWSKPTIARVKWKGTTKLVMFVGGGYDAGGTDGNGIFENGVRKEYAGYEQPDYNQENSRGGGVYMFDAINGDLLWWGSANVSSSTEATADPDLAETRHEDLKYSVVSQINAIDRDEDGLADHLYFGDLGGQAFRIDIDNRANITKSGGFVKRIERLFNEHQANGASPRFYEMPSVSAYNVLNQVRAVVAFNSGNRSSPLAGTNRKSDSTNEVTTSAVDALYVTYDYNVTRTNLYTANAATENAWSKPTTWFDYNKKEGVAFNEATTRGWKYTYSTTAGEMKGVNELETLGAFLYASVYEKDKNPDGSSSNESTSCNAGVRGSSRTLRYCLPTGLCTAQMHGFSSADSSDNKPDSTSGKSGLVTSTIGGKKTNSVGLVDSGLNKPNCQTNPSHIDCAETPLSGKINQLRWYESR